jgi:hypothetical protein
MDAKISKLHLKTNRTLPVEAEDLRIEKGHLVVPTSYSEQVSREAKEMTKLLNRVLKKETVKELSDLEKKKTRREEEDNQKGEKKHPWWRTPPMTHIATPY